jgi:hypothetical protein
MTAFSHLKAGDTAHIPYAPDGTVPPTSAAGPTVTVVAPPTPCQTGGCDAWLLIGRTPTGATIAVHRLPHRPANLAGEDI